MPLGSPGAREGLARDASDVSRRHTPSPPPPLDEGEGDEDLASPRTSLLSEEEQGEINDDTEHKPAKDDAQEVSASQPKTANLQTPDAKAEKAAAPLEERSYVFETRVEKARELWTLGKAHFEKGELDQAKVLFERGVYHADFDELQFNFELMDAHRAQVVEVKVPLLLNLALLALKRSDGQTCLEYCTQAISLSPENPKAHYRRGMSHALLGSDVKAKADFEHALKLAPRSTEARQALSECLERIRKSELGFAESWPKGTLLGSFGASGPDKRHPKETYSDNGALLTKASPAHWSLSSLLELIISMLSMLLSWLKPNRQAREARS